LNKINTNLQGIGVHSYTIEKPFYEWDLMEVILQISKV
jgi:hypothetical protein